MIHSTEGNGIERKTRQVFADIDRVPRSKPVLAQMRTVPLTYLTRCRTYRSHFRIICDKMSNISSNMPSTLTGPNAGVRMRSAVRCVSACWAMLRKTLTRFNLRATPQFSSPWNAVNLAKLSARVQRAATLARTVHRLRDYASLRAQFPEHVCRTASRRGLRLPKHGC